ncbi:MAG: hypothetical protein PHQ72_06460 [Hespellia sp.]|nr:hypothetical protein [Hespellia sp.]
MKDLPYTALVRIIEAEDMPISTFTTAVYQLAMDYGIERQNVNINGKFEQSLQDGNSGAYTILFVSILLFIASGIVIYSVFALWRKHSPCTAQYSYNTDTRYSVRFWLYFFHEKLSKIFGVSVSSCSSYSLYDWHDRHSDADFRCFFFFLLPEIPQS